MLKTDLKYINFSYNNSKIIMAARKVSVITAFLCLTFTSAAWSFSSTKQINPPSASLPAAKITPDKSVIIPEIMALPENYTDTTGIKKYSAEQPVNNDLNVVMQQLDDLRNSYSHLKQELAQRGPEKPAEDPRDQEAKRSGFSFAGLESGVDKLVGPGGTANDKIKSQEFPDESDKMKIKPKDRSDEIYDSRALIKPASPYQLMMGTIIPASLVTAINSTVPGIVVAHVTRNIYDSVTGKYLLIPRGSKAIGEYNSRSISAGQTRVALEFNRIVRPDGSSIQLGRFAATDTQGSSGLEGEVDNHWGQIVAASVLGALINYGAGSISDRVGRKNNKDYETSRQTSITNAGAGFTNVTNNLTNRALSIPPTIKLPAGYPLNITVKKDMILTPYSDF